MKMNRQATESDKIFALYIFNKGLISRVHKEFSKLNRKKKTCIKEMGEKHEQTFHRGGETDANKHMKRCSTPLAFRRA